MKIRLFGTVDDSIVDGPGLRYAIFVQGCKHNCLNCHNPKSHDLNGGYLKDINEIFDEIKANTLLDGITLSGGEPMLQPLPLIELCKLVKPLGLNIVLYSGYTFEEIMKLGDKQRELLGLCDILIDGRFVQAKRSLALLYRGSSNQRIIDIQKSLVSNEVVECKIDEFGQLIF